MQEEIIWYLSLPVATGVSLSVSASLSVSVSMFVLRVCVSVSVSVCANTIDDNAKMTYNYSLCE